jgi:hypothetical protein
MAIRLRKKSKDAKNPHEHRLGFMKGEISVPADFDEMGRDVIAALFGFAGHVPVAEAFLIASRGFH